MEEQPTSLGQVAVPEAEGAEVYSMECGSVTRFMSWTVDENAPMEMSTLCLNL